MIAKHYKYPIILHSCQARLPIYLFGPTGSGKTHIFRDIAAEMGLTFYKKLIGAQMSESSLLGYMDAHGNYVPGIVYKPYTEGGLLVLDEIDNGNPNTNLVVNGVCDQELAFPCGMKERHKDFVVVATANTTGNGATMQYVGRNKLDAAMLNRFIFIEFDYDLDLEMQLAKHEYTTWLPLDHVGNAEVFESSVHDFWRIRNAIKEAQVDNHILSQRNLLQQSRMIAMGFDKQIILQSVILRNLNAQQQKNIMDLAIKVKVEELRKHYVDNLKELPQPELDKIEQQVKTEVQNEINKKINELRNQQRIKLLQIEQLKIVNNQGIADESAKLAALAKELEKAKQEAIKNSPFKPNMPKWGE